MRPVTALAAAVRGLTRSVRAPFPWRPSKFRLLVLIEYSPLATVSPFMPMHMEQPDSRHSAPASMKMRSSPSASAAFFTCCEPGTTSARTPRAIWWPRSNWAALRRSEEAYGPQAALIAELFTGRLRYTGASIGYQLASVIAGGPAPLIAAWLFQQYGSGYAIAVFIAGCGIISLIALSFMKDYTGEDIALEYDDA